MARCLWEGRRSISFTELDRPCIGGMSCQHSKPPLVTQECTEANKRIDLQPFTAYDNQNSRNAGVIRTHVTVSVSVCCVLFAGDRLSGASYAGGRDCVRDVVYEWRRVVERQRGAEIGCCFLRRHVADAARFDG